MADSVGRSWGDDESWWSNHARDDDELQGGDQWWRNNRTRDDDRLQGGNEWWWSGHTRDDGEQDRADYYGDAAWTGVAAEAAIVSSSSAAASDFTEQLRIGKAAQIAEEGI